MTLDSSGRLGIGLTPSYKLDVDVGAPASQDQLLGRFSSQAGVRSIAFVWDDSQSTLGIGTQTNHSLAFHINGSSAERLRIDTYGGLNIKSVAGTQAATFGGANLVNGITALPSSAGTPFVVGRDTGTLRSAHFAGHLKFNSGYGIDFDVSNLANGTVGSNVLDDYEEGTFTMGMQTSGNNASLSIGNQTAYYTKIGNLVTFYWYSTGVNVTNAGSGYVVLSGFPFTSSSASNLYGLLHTSHTTVANTDGGYIANNSTVGYLVQQHSTSGAGFNTGYPLYIMVQGFYYTA